MSKNIVIFEHDEETVEIIKGYLSEIKEIEEVISFSDFAEGYRYIRENDITTVIFSIQNDKQSSLKMIKKLFDTNVRVIALSEDYTTSNIIQILRSGAKDFVSKPIIAKDLVVAIIKCMQDDVRLLNKSQIISVFSNKGGVGKTTIATNLAYEFARLTREKVVLVDLNLPIGDVTTFLDIKPIVDISEIINNSDSANKNMLFEACQRYNDSSLYVLAEPPFIAQSRNLTASQIINLFKYLREHFSYIIIDMGTNVDNFNMTILKKSDVILLVSVINLPLIRNCQRCLDLFQNLEFPESKIKILINRYLENDEITVEDVERTLNKQVYWKIPNNYYTIMSSINKAIPVSEVNENSNITESFTMLASKMADELIENNFNL